MSSSNTLYLCGTLMNYLRVERNLKDTQDIEKMGWQG